MDRELEDELEKRLKQVFSGYSELAGGRNYRYHHLVSSRNYAEKLIEHVDEDVDEDAVKIGALFHDIGRSKDIEDGYLDPMETHEGHDATGESIIEEHIGDTVDPETLEKVEQAIGNHHSDPESVEDEVVQDSDLLFKYGIHGVWRTFHYASEKERELPESIAYIQEEKIPRLENRLEEFNLDISREIAEKRLEDLKKAVRKMEIELNGEDI